jgi:hypothetical protein
MHIRHKQWKGLGRHTGASESRSAGYLKTVSLALRKKFKRPSNCETRVNPHANEFDAQ